MNQKVWNQFIQKVTSARITNIIISQNGERIAEHHFDEEHRRNIYSATKSFTSAAIGIAIAEGLVSIQEKLVDCFPEKLPDRISGNLEKATVEHLLTMTLGQGKSYLMGGQRPFMKEEDWVHFSLSQAFDNLPGTTFLYNNVGPYLAGILISKRAGCTLEEYLRNRLFEPLGIKRVTWEVDPLGNTFGAGGLFLTTSELLKFGELLLNQGRAKDVQIIPKEYINAAKSPYLPVEKSGTNYGYGYLFWMGPHGTYRADGKYGQFCIISEEKKAVIAINAESRDPNEFMNDFWDIVYPEL